MITLYRYLGDHSWEEVDIWSETKPEDNNKPFVFSRFRHPKIKTRVYESEVTPTKTKSSYDRVDTVVNRKVSDMIRKKGWSLEKTEEQHQGDFKFENYDDHKDSLQYPVFASHKLDGINATWKDGKLWSRGKKEIHMPHITKVLQEHAPHLELTGELWSSGRALEEIKGLVDHGSEELVFFLYMDKQRSLETNAYLAWMCLFEVVGYIGESCIGIVPGTVVKNEESLDKYFNWVLRDGKEGLVVWSADARWEPKRSKKVLKRKPLYRDELMVKEVTSDKDSKGPMISFICECKGTKFKVVPNWTKDKRVEEYQRDHSSIVGRSLTVEHRGFTKYGVPKHARAIGYREDV